MPARRPSPAARTCGSWRTSCTSCGWNRPGRSRLEGALLGGHVNELGVAVSLLAMALRLWVRGGRGPVRYPEIATRLLFFAALPIVAGSPRGLLAFTLPQTLIAIVEARQRDAALAGSGRASAAARGARPHRIVPGVW